VSPRPKDPPPDRRQEILDAALRVFAREGFAAATNARIAREAGITPAALYWYFTSKQQLFLAAVTERREHFMSIAADFERMSAASTPEEVLPAVVAGIFRLLTEERTKLLVRIMLSEGHRQPDLVEIWIAQIGGSVFPVTVQYLLSQMDLGRIRRMDPRVVIMMIGGAALQLVVLRDLLRVPFVEGLEVETAARQVAESLLRGILAPQ
jgi:AcrR family transcriptional regulator